MKVGRNAPCPCGTGAKYKFCCEGKKDWEAILKQGRSAQVRNLSTRGKNIAFLNALASALQSEERAQSWGDFKRKFTPAAVEKIYDAVAQLWPNGEDLHRVLAADRQSTTGLYVGTYEPEAIFQGVTRHCIYSDTILLVDPFLHPRRTREEFNPLVHPERHRASAIIAANIWLAMAPWVKAGIVKFVRVPGDFDSRLATEADAVQKLRFSAHPELQSLIERDIPQKERMTKTLGWYHVLCHPDETLLDDYRKMFPDASEADLAFFLRYIQQARDAHPYYMPPVFSEEGKAAEFVVQTSGASYEMAKRTALLSGSYVVTDLPSRWREIEIDRADGAIDSRRWTPIAKAFQDLGFKYLQNIPLEAALRLREEGRLEDMRGFMRKMWKACGGEEPFSDEKVVGLAAELQERVREAESEWRKIDAELLRWFGGLGAVAAPFIAAGGATWVPAAIAAAIGGAAAVGHAQYQRSSFEKRYPAGFFLELREAAKD